MKIVEVNNNNFEEEVINSEKPVLVDFYANWCGPCKMLRPVLEELAEEVNEYKIVSINVDEENDLAMKYEISSIPCLIAFKNGVDVDRSVGLVSKNHIKNLMEEI